MDSETLDSYWEDGGGYLRLKKQWINAESGGANGACGQAEKDCVETTYGYDTLGNINSVQKSGGYGEGFGISVPAEVTEYLHGKPVKKSLASTSEELLLWERSVDPWTGLTRWQVDGSGVGQAYYYDSLGRVTHVVPVEGAYDGSEWTLGLQPYTFDANGDGTAWVQGKYFEYSVPGPAGSGLAWRSVSDAPFLPEEISSIGTITPLDPGTDERAKLYLDGMGRPTQLTEYYPGDGSSHRSRFSLGYFNDSKDYSSGGTSSNPCDYALPDESVDSARVARMSGWIDGSFWPGCTSTALNWTTTRYDRLNRPQIQELPDGNKVTTDYVGASLVSTTRSVATSTSGSETSSTTIATSDAFGRLVNLDEEVASGQAVSSSHDYDVKDRMRAMEVSTGSESQSRSFKYSAAGFLIESIEPERYTSYQKYDALGNVWFEYSRLDEGDADPVDAISATYTYDGLGRLSHKHAGPPGGLLEMAVFSYYGIGEDDIGEPHYNKVEKATQNNHYWNGDDLSTTTVEHSWGYGSPGGRTTSRATHIGGSGIGGDSDSFLITYGHDKWGNRNYIGHPRWSPWVDTCPRELIIEQEYTFDGSWLESTALYKDLQSTAFAAAYQKYHPSGRTAETDMYASGTNVGIQTEGKDDHGMARPKSLTFTVGSQQAWAQTGFSYDGSGNIASFNVEYRRLVLAEGIYL